MLSSGLSLIENRKFLGVAMPVVAVELNNQPQRRDKGIHTKLSTDKVLRLIGYAQFVKCGVSDFLKFRHFHRLLNLVQAYQLSALDRVCISALKRTILDAVLSAWNHRGRKAKYLLTYLANETDLVSSPPLIATPQTTKAGFCFSEFRFCFVHGLAALLAGDFCSSFPTRSTRSSIT